MSATMSDLLTATNDGTRPQRDALTAPKAIGASFLQAGTLTGWTTETAVHFTLYKKDPTKVDAYGNPLKIPGSQSDWKGVRSGTTITQLELKAGVDDNYPAGSIIVAAPTSGFADDLYEWGTTEHDSLGHHTDIHAETGTFSGLVTANAGLSVPTGPVTIPAAKIADNGIWWQELGRTTLGSNAQEIAVAFTTAKKYLTVIINAHMSGGSSIVEECIRFNDDSGANYTHTHQALILSAGGAATQNIGWQSIDTKFDVSYQPQATDYSSTILTITNNVSGSQKTFTGTNSYGGTNATAPNPPYTVWGHWQGTAAITKVSLINTAANTNGFATGSEMIVLGHD